MKALTILFIMAIAMTAWAQSPAPSLTPALSKEEIMAQFQARLEAKRQADAAAAKAAVDARHAAEADEAARAAEARSCERVSGEVIEYRPNGVRVLLKRPIRGSDVCFLKGYNAKVKHSEQWIDILGKYEGNYTYGARDGFDYTIPCFSYFANPNERAEKVISPFGADSHMKGTALGGASQHSMLDQAAH